MSGNAKGLNIDHAALSKYPCEPKHGGPIIDEPRHQRGGARQGLDVLTQKPRTPYVTSADGERRQDRRKGIEGLRTTSLCSLSRQADFAKPAPRPLVKVKLRPFPANRLKKNKGRKKERKAKREWRRELFYYRPASKQLGSLKTMMS